METPDLPLTDVGAQVALRSWRETDGPVLARAWATPDIARHSVVPACAEEVGARRWIRGWEARLGVGLALDLVIGPLAGDAVWGEVGLARLLLRASATGSHPHTRSVWDVGWWLLPEHRGQGRAAAGVGLLVAWAGAALDDPLVARVATPASAPVAARAGFERRGPYDAGHDLWVVPSTPSVPFVAPRPADEGGV